MAHPEKIFIRIRSFDQYSIDQYIINIIQNVTEEEGYIVGPVPSPMENLKTFIDMSNNIDKTNREKINPRLKHKRFLYITDNTKKGLLIDKIINLKIPNGVGIEIQMKR